MRTCLYDEHLRLGAKIVNFSGWEMPLYYSGIIQEHQAVRKGAGVFDVSHMGRIGVEGIGAESFLEWLSPNTIADKRDFSAIYTVFCRENGTAVDDLIIYKIDSNHFFLIVNASNRMKDLEHLYQHSSSFDVTVTEKFSGQGILSLQGPNAETFLSELYPGIKKLKFMHFAPFESEGETFFISRTGYTGADGFEVFGSDGIITKTWFHLMMKGVVPVGLGARDTLRLEMGFALYGHELDDSITPVNTVSDWVIHWNKDFLGKEKLEEVKKEERRYRQYGLLLETGGVPRQHCEVHDRGEIIGKVTSGNFSPSLGKPIALVMVDKDLELGQKVEVKIRSQYCEGEIVKLPFIDKNRKAQK